MTSKLAAITIGLSLNALAATAGSPSMPVAQQNAMVQKYCAVCHTDAVPGGGLTLQHFDGAHADPGVAAMMLSKLTNGTLLNKLSAAKSNPEAAALIATWMKGGAMGAAGVGVPDRDAQDAFVLALAGEVTGATNWVVNQQPVLTASIVQEVPLRDSATAANHYRLTLTCRPDTHEARMQLAWSPGVPKQGQEMTAAPDGKSSATYKIEGKETYANGMAGTSGPGAINLDATKLPAHALTVTNVFPNETVVFPFDGLDKKVHRTLSACF